MLFQTVSERNVSVSEAQTMKLEMNPSLLHSSSFQSRETRSAHSSRLRSADDGRYIATTPLTNSITSLAPPVRPGSQGYIPGIS